MAAATPAPAARPALTIIVPAYDEESRLPSSLQALGEFAAAFAQPVELVLVDDGSRDGTVEVAREAEAHLPPNVTLRLVSCAVNGGKGAAVRAGAFFATGGVVVVLDADLNTPPSEVYKVLDRLAQGFDVVAGTRIQPGGFDMRASQPLSRRLAGRLFTRVRSLLLLPQIDDTQCPLKGFRREAALAVFVRQRLGGWSFDAEILYIAQRLGFRVGQVPVEWRHVGDSRVRVSLGTSLTVLRDLLRIRWTHRHLQPLAMPAPVAPPAHRA